MVKPGLVVRRLLFSSSGVRIRPDALFILPLLKQLHLPLQEQNFLLLQCDSLIERVYGILLVGQLGLHLIQLQS